MYLQRKAAPAGPAPQRGKSGAPRPPGARGREDPLATRGFDGVTGAISYPEGRRVPQKSVSILTLRDGHFAFVQEAHPD